MEINWNVQMHKFVTGTIKSMVIWMSVLAIIWAALQIVSL